MYIRQKLNQILRRINFFAGSLPNDGEYKEGFLHALNLTKVAIRLELREFVQTSENKTMLIEQLTKENFMLRMSLENSKAHSTRLLEIVDEVSERDISNRKVKNICRIIAKMTGQPYSYIKEEFAEYLSGKKRLHACDYE